MMQHQRKTSGSIRSFSVLDVASLSAIDKKVGALGKQQSSVRSTGNKQGPTLSKLVREKLSQIEIFSAQMKQS